MRPRILPQLLKTLKRLRQDAGLTQEEFAERAKMSYKYYQQIEAGRKSDLRLSTLEKLARAHGITLSRLLNEERKI
jgi:transcriptional regulator with XRE-family HTH domain